MWGQILSMWVTNTWYLPVPKAEGGQGRRKTAVKDKETEEIGKLSSYESQTNH